MEAELKTLLKSTLYLTTSLTFTHFISSHLPPGKLRFLSFIPAFTLLLSTPWHFSTIHLRAISSLFLVWLSLFKLLLLSFSNSTGPLSPSLPLPTFIASASLPVKLKPLNNNNSQIQLQAKKWVAPAIKAVLLAVVVSLYRYRDMIPKYLLWCMYCIHVYLAVDLVLGGIATVTELVIPQLQLEPQFNAPLLSSSLSDFWGRRWNLMVPAILRPSVYIPVRKRFGRAAGVLATFLVSGLMHEVLIYYMAARPTGEVTCFFVLHGVCVLMENYARRARWWRPLPKAVAVPMTLGFVVVTVFWLFFPTVLRSGTDQRVVEESIAMLEFLEKVVWLKGWK